MKCRPNNSSKRSEKTWHTEEEKRKAFVDFIAQIIVDISIKQYQEEKPQKYQIN